MKAVILAGGSGTRISEETDVKPKPMIEIGDKPILWHIMKIYSSYGVDDFVICLGYKGYLIKEFFANYFLHTCDVTFDVATNQMEVHQCAAEPWRVTLVDTGNETMTGGRLRRVLGYLGDEDFCLTYGDGVADINISSLLAFHSAHGLLATVTAVRPVGRFGSMEVVNGRVPRFLEKPQGDGGWINGGFFVVSPKVSRYLEGDETVWEQHTLPRLAQDGQLASFEHSGFWHPMDTLREKKQLQDLWASKRAPWKTW
jgi:glucose-1-phosphate cytidylyltransferase